jgi:hypothetical protein
MLELQGGCRRGIGICYKGVVVGGRKDKALVD